jgi:hypothetical protein
MNITAQTILEEWNARVGNITDRQAPAWKRVLEDREVIRDYPTAMEAVKVVSAEVERGQHKRIPGLTHFEKTYRSLVARFERERYESDGEVEGCTGCGKSGLVAVVMAWSIMDKRYKPVPRDRVPACDGKAYRCYIPCNCEKGQGINIGSGVEGRPKYSRDILRRLHFHCVFEHNNDADNHMLQCIRKATPQQQETR